MRLSRAGLGATIAVVMIAAACDDSSSGGSSSGAIDASFDGAVAQPDGSTGDGGGVIDCPAPTAGPTQHQGSVGTETWTAADSPHVLASGIGITGTLTLEPCAEVLVGAGKLITVSSTGKLVAEGLVTKPIHIGASEAGKPFAQIYANNGGTLRLVHVNIDGAGDPLSTPADLAGAVFAQGSDQTAPTQETVFVDTVTLTGSKGSGFVLRDGAGFAAGSRALTVTGSAHFPISIWARAVGTVPSGSYTGNGKDEIVLPAGGGAEAIQEDITMRARGVPYRIGDSLSGSTMTIAKQGAAPGVATLTIEPGVTLRVKKGGVIHVQTSTGSSPARGALVAQGTAASPIVFTSAEATPAAGDWLGIYYGLLPSAANKLDHVRVEYAGGASSAGSSACNTPGTNDAAVRIFGTPGGGAFVTNSTIASSAGHGIDRGYRDDVKHDFMATNTFVSVAGCKQSYNADANGSCPTTVPCP